MLGRSPGNRRAERHARERPRSPARLGFRGDARTGPASPRVSTMPVYCARQAYAVLRPAHAGCVNTARSHARRRGRSRPARRARASATETRQPSACSPASFAGSTADRCPARASRRPDLRAPSSAEAAPTAGTSSPACAQARTPSTSATAVDHPIGQHGTPWSYRWPQLPAHVALGTGQTKALPAVTAMPRAAATAISAFRCIGEPSRQGRRLRPRHRRRPSPEGNLRPR